MMPQNRLEPGDLVSMLAEDWNGVAGVVSQEISEDHPGHVLVYKDDCILGVNVLIQDVIPAASCNQ